TTGGIGPMSGVRDYDLMTGFTTFLMVSARDKETRQFPLRPCSRMERDSIHPGDFRQGFFETCEQLEGALRQMRRSPRMDFRKAPQRRHLIVDDGVVLHGA